MSYVIQEGKWCFMQNSRPDLKPAIVKTLLPPMLQTAENLYFDLLILFEYWYQIAVCYFHKFQERCLLMLQHMTTHFGMAVALNITFSE